MYVLSFNLGCWSGADRRWSFLSGSRGEFGVILLCLMVIGAVYGQSVHLPFIQDDWAYLRTFQSVPAGKVVENFVRFDGALMYRPLGNIYMLLVYKIFGENPVAFHVLALTIHSVNAYLVISCMRVIVNDRLIAFLCGVIYAAAVSVHVDPLAWAVGIYDLGGAFLFFLSVRFFLSGLNVLAAAAYFAGCLFKESVVVLPLILLLYEILFSGRSWRCLLSWKGGVRFAPFVLAGGVIVLIKIAGQPPMSLPGSHPYALGGDLMPIMENLTRYLKWMFQAFFPFMNPSDRTFVAVSSAFFAFLLFGVVVASFSSRRDDSRLVVLLSAWVLVGLLPVLFLAHHSYRYYTIYSLPAFVGLSLVLVRDVFDYIFKSGRWSAASVVAASVFAVGCSMWQGMHIYKEKLEYSTLSDGTCELIRSAELVRIVRDGLLRQLPSVPNNAYLVFEGVNTIAFNGFWGPQYWYANGSLHVLDAAEVKSGDGRLYIEEGNGKTFIDSSNLFMFTMRSGELVREGRHAL